MKHMKLALCLAALAALGGTASKAEASPNGPPGGKALALNRARFGGVGFGIGVGGCRPCWNRGCFPGGGFFPRRPFPCRPFPGPCFPGPRFPRFVR